MQLQLKDDFANDKWRRPDSLVKKDKTSVMRFFVLQ